MMMVVVVAVSCATVIVHCLVVVTSFGKMSLLCACDVAAVTFDRPLHMRTCLVGYEQLPGNHFSGGAKRISPQATQKRRQRLTEAPDVSLYPRNGRGSAQHSTVSDCRRMRAAYHRSRPCETKQQHQRPGARNHRPPSHIRSRS